MSIAERLQFRSGFAAFECNLGVLVARFLFEVAFNMATSLDVLRKLG
jgi:hypothetical protein